MRLLAKTLTVAAATTLLVGSATAAFAVGSDIANGDFETGAPGDTTITGWTSVNQRIDLGVTQIADCTTVDTSDYSALRNYDNEFILEHYEVGRDEFGDPFVDDNGNYIPILDNGNYIPRLNDADPPQPRYPNGPLSSSDPSVNKDSLELTLDEEYVTSLKDGNGINPDFSRNSQIVELFSDLRNSSPDPDGYVVHGPAIYSEIFTAKTIDDLQFQWAASDDEDDYHVFGYLLNVETCEQTEVIDSTGQSSFWQTVEAAVPANGDYRFVFVSGTFDATFGGAAGAYLYLDDASIVVNEERAAAEAAAAEAAQLAKTGSDLTLAGIAGAALVALGGVTLLSRRRNAPS